MSGDSRIRPYSAYSVIDAVRQEHAALGDDPGTFGEGVEWALGQVERRMRNAGDLHRMIDGNYKQALARLVAVLLANKTLTQSKISEFAALGIADVRELRKYAAEMANPSDAPASAVVEVVEAADCVQAFLAQSCEFGAGFEIPVFDLYVAYRRFAGDGVGARTHTAFHRQVRCKGYATVRRGAINHYAGLRLKVEVKDHAQRGDR